MLTGKTVLRTARIGVIQSRKFSSQPKDSRFSTVCLADFNREEMGLHFRIGFGNPHHWHSSAAGCVSRRCALARKAGKGVD